MNFRFLFLFHLFFLLCNFSLGNEIINIKLGTDLSYTIDDKNSDIQIYKIGTNYKTISVKIYSITNIKIIQITDVKEINDILLCNETSNFCQIRTISRNSEINFLNSICIKEIYILIKKENEKIKSSLSIKVEIKPESEGCKFPNENSLSYCGQSNIEDCRKCKRLSCTVIQCGSIDKNNNNNFISLHELCIPYYLTDNEKLNRCQNFNNVNSFQSSGKCEYDDLEGFGFITIFIIFIIVIGIIIFSVSAIYYNIYLYKTGEIPFEPFNFMPEFLFPRNEGHRNTIDNLDNIFNPQRFEN